MIMLIINSDQNQFQLILVCIFKKYKHQKNKFIYVFDMYHQFQKCI